MSEHRVSGHLAGTFEQVIASSIGRREAYKALAVILEISKDDEWSVRFSVTRTDHGKPQVQFYPALSEAIRAYDKAGAA